MSGKERIRRVMAPGPGVGGATLGVAAMPAWGADVPGALGIVDLLAPLLIVIGLGVAAWWIVRRSGVRVGNRGGPLRIAQAVSLGPRERLVVLEITEGERRGEALLVGVTGQRVELIDRLGARPVDASGERVDRADMASG